ncbi:MAG: hypothetical protein QM723_08590 [Myxococcaceae bacterium]
MRRLLLAGLVSIGCAHTTAAAALRSWALPGATGEVTLDYLLFDRAKGRLWIPAANTGRVDVLDTHSDTLLDVGGFTVVEREGRRGKRLLGPSSAALGNGMVFIGNRGSSEVCTIDERSLRRHGCVQLDSPPDGLAFVGTTQELWVTTPKSQSLTILDVSKPESPVVKESIALPGDPEGYAVDDEHGLFFTNLEDKDRALSIDVRTRKIVSDHPAGCGETGPRGVAIDVARHLAFVACTSSVSVLDLEHDGSVLAKVSTGNGVDNIDYVPSLGLLLVPAGKDALLDELQVGEHGALTQKRRVPTVSGAKVVVADASGNAYLVDPRGAVVRVPFSEAR